MSRKSGRIYYENKREGTVLASRTDKNGVKHCGRGSNRSEATAALHLTEKGKNVVSSTAQPQHAASLAATS
jgi:hypothetical protein